MTIPNALLLIAWTGLVLAAEPAIPDGRSTDTSLILGRPTDRSVSLSILSKRAMTCCVEFGDAAKPFARITAEATVKPGVPQVIEIDGLAADTAYAYRLRARPDGALIGASGSFHTQRRPGSNFTFAVQGDSHPERPGKMYHADLYVQTMRNVVKDAPDFHITLGDDFSIERLIERQNLTQSAVDQVYADQRPFLGMVGRSASLFLVNGNHEQAGRWWLDGTATNPAVLAGRARNTFYPLPAPGPFYSGDTEEVPHIGLLRDYYAWTWGDALFVTIDPYWHSPVQVDHDRNKGGGGGKGGKKGKDAGQGQAKNEGDGGGKAPPRDLWQVTLGDAQFHWLEKTLSSSTARFKFVFAHHVMGTGRGGIELARQYEWGGLDRNGNNLFAQKRPGWSMPVHQLMVKHGVTIFFQGHDHIFARQELDGVVYQSMPCPADDTYTAFNKEAYRSGDIHPDAGHVRVAVSGQQVTVDYVRAFLSKDENATQKNGAVAFSYSIAAKNLR